MRANLRNRFSTIMFKMGARLMKSDVSLFRSIGGHICKWCGWFDAGTDIKYG